MTPIRVFRLPVLGYEQRADGCPASDLSPAPSHSVQRRDRERRHRIVDRVRGRLPYLNKLVVSLARDLGALNYFCPDTAGSLPASPVWLRHLSPLGFVYMGPGAPALLFLQVGPSGTAVSKDGKPTITG